MEIIKLPIEDIQPYWRNPRRITDDAINKVAESIRRYGFNVPLIIDKNKVIIAGHTRYKALLSLGYSEVDCVMIDLDERKAREFRLIDNKTHELTDWNSELLVFELRELNVADLSSFFDVESIVNQSVGIDDIKIVDDNDISKMEGNVSGMFAEKSVDVSNDYVKVICPNCGNIFYISKDDVMKDYKDKLRVKEK